VIRPRQALALTRRPRLSMIRVSAAAKRCLPLVRLTITTSLPYLCPNLA